MRSLKLLAILAWLASSAVHAEILNRVDLKPALVSGFVSRHINVRKEFNENNYDIVVPGCVRSARRILPEQRVPKQRLRQVRGALKLTDNLHAGVTPLLLPKVVLQVGRSARPTTYIPKVPVYTSELVALQARGGW